MYSRVDKPCEPSVIRILAIIVVYKMSPLHTPSFTSLQRARDAVSGGTLDLKILLYNNSRDGEEPTDIPQGVEYRVSSRNTGLSSAYNYAISLAVEGGYDWLLTLDQDTVLPTNFLLRVTEIATAVAQDLSIASIVPLITEGGRSLSPNWFFGGAWPRFYDRRTIGVADHPTFAFNSASTLRVSSLVEVGGYNPWFWLDYSDGYIFRELQRHGKKVFVAGDLEVAHDYALTDIENRVSLSRYRNMRLAESAFWDLEMGTTAGLERTWGLVRLAIKHLLFRKSPEHSGVTYEFLKRRLFWTRKRRLDAWRRETLHLFPELGSVESPPQRPM